FIGCACDGGMDAARGGGVDGIGAGGLVDGVCADCTDGAGCCCRCATGDRVPEASVAGSGAGGAVPSGSVLSTGARVSAEGACFEMSVASGVALGRFGAPFARAASVGAPPTSSSVLGLIAMPRPICF